MALALRRLGNEGLVVSALGCGCWGMSHAYGRADEAEALATITAAFELGINFFDTADVYGDGHNERLLAKALADRRPQAIVATKFGFVGDEHGRFSINGRPDYVFKACQASLKRLGSDYIDLYYLHRRDPEVPIEETVGAMSRLVEQGKVRFLGLSEVSAATLRQAHAVWPISAVQSEYSLWTRQVEDELLPACRRLGVGLVAFSPLGRGFLTGAVRSHGDLAPNDYRRNLPRFQPGMIERNRAALEPLLETAAGLGCSPAQVALAWLMARDESVVPVVGMKSRHHLRDNLEALQITLSEADIQRLDQLWQRVSGARHDDYNLQFME